MNKLVVTGVLVILLLGFVASTYASYNGVGLVSSGTGPNTRGVLFIFPGGGPGSGK